MTNSHPFQKHVCIFLVSIGLLTYYLTMKQSVLIPNKKPYGYDLNESQFDFLNDPDNHTENNTDFFLSSFRESDEVNKVWKKKTVVNILGLFELTTPQGPREEGNSEVIAAKLAIDHINEMNFLPGFSLNLLVNDTRCDPGVGVDRFFYALYSNKNILVLLGSSCSNVTESLAHVVPYWNIPQVSFGSTSPTLSDRNKFPLFFRTVAPDSSHNNAKIQFIKSFGWEVVTAFSQSENAFLLPINNLVKELENANISCVATITFSLDNYKEQLKALKDLDIRIILGSFSSELTSKIFCEAAQLKMYGRDYVWILQDHQNVWKELSRKIDECETDQLKQATDGLVLVSDINWIPGNETSVSGLTTDEFGKQLLASNVTSTSKYMNYVYDAIWAIAFALHGNKLITCSYSMYYYHRRREMVGEFVHKMESLHFIGLSGPVKFSGPDRVGDSMFSQIQDLRKTQIAVYESDKNRLNFNCQNCKDISWKHGKVPIAQRILRTLTLRIPPYTYYFVFFMSLFGIFTSTLFLYFSLRFRRVKCLKLSSPKLNNVAILGCISVYCSVALMEIDDVMENSDRLFTRLCTAKAYLLSAGFSLIFGTIFAKTYRVHKLFNHCRTSVVKTKLLKDRHLIALISSPVIIDAIIVSLWVVIDPMERSRHNLTLEASSRSGVVYQRQVEVCGSSNTIGWYFALYGYKALVLIMGVFMAWENRHVKVPTLNNIHYIGICVYSAIFSSIVLIFANFIEQYVIVSYLISSCTILVTTSIILVLLFLPQFKMIFGSMQNDDLLMQTMGLKFEYNTRRFIYKDQRELFNRLEIQNRVFKCEIEALDEEIRYLENLLLMPSDSSDNSTSDIYTITKAFQDKPELSCGRASWPTSISQSTKGAPRFSSENRLNEHFFDRFRIFGKLKKFFGSLSSIGDFGSQPTDSDENIQPAENQCVSNAERESVLCLEIREIKKFPSDSSIN